MGEPDPATSLIEQINSDPDKELLGDLLQAWRDAFGQRSTMVRQAIRHTEDHKDDDLHAAIMELPCVEGGRINQSKLGRYIARNRNRIVRGLRFVDGEHSERKAWQVLPVGQTKALPVHDMPQPVPERAFYKGTPVFQSDPTAFFDA